MSKQIGDTRDVRDRARLRRSPRARVRGVGGREREGPVVRAAGGEHEHELDFRVGGREHFAGGGRGRGVHLRRALRRHRRGRADRLHLQHAPRRRADVGVGDDGRAARGRARARTCATPSRACSSTATTRRRSASTGRGSCSTSSARRSRRGRDGMSADAGTRRAQATRARSSGRRGRGERALALAGAVRAVRGDADDRPRRDDRERRAAVDPGRPALLDARASRGS